MDAEDYSFFLAYGMTQEDEAEDSLLDVEMYNIMPDFLRWTNLVDGTAYEEIQGYWFLISFFSDNTGYK